MASAGKDEKLPTEISDTFDLVKRYFLQETVGPLRGIGRVIGFGMVGSLFLGIGLVVLDLAVLRVLQEQTGRTFAGHLNVIPYVIAVVVALMALVVVIMLATREPGGGRPKGRQAPGGS